MASQRHENRERCRGTVSSDSRRHFCRCLLTNAFAYNQHGRLSSRFSGLTKSGIEARNDVTVAVRNWFANRNPLVTRLPYVPVERVDFLMYTHRYRARSTILARAISSNSTTSLTFADATFLMNHDVLQLVDSATRQHGIRSNLVATRRARRP